MENAYWLGVTTGFVAACGLTAILFYLFGGA